MALEVVNNRLALLSDFAKVGCPSPLCQQEEHVEHLEDRRRGLMYGAENGLAVVGKTAQQCADRPCRLAVES